MVFPFGWWVFNGAHTHLFWTVVLLLQVSSPESLSARVFLMWLGVGIWVLVFMWSTSESVWHYRVKRSTGSVRALALTPHPSTWSNSVLVFISSNRCVFSSAFPISLMRKNTFICVFVLLSIISSSFLAILLGSHLFFFKPHLFWILFFF